MAREFGSHGIRVNVVAPGLTLTDVHRSTPDEVLQALAARSPFGRNAVPEDVAGAIVLLASDLAAFITGGYLVANGGALV